MNEILYKQLRNLPIYKSKKFLAWVKQKYPDKEVHHLLGSMTGIKLNDYLVKPVQRQEHLEAEKHKQDFAIANLPQSLNILFQYIKELELKPTWTQNTNLRNL